MTETTQQVVESMARAITKEVMHLTEGGVKQLNEYMLAPFIRGYLSVALRELETSQND